METITLVLLPGLDGTGRLFSPLIGKLPAWIKPVVVSYPVDKPYGYEELYKIVSAALPVDTDFVVLGESFSGPLAIMCAARQPTGLRGIILCATFVRKPFRLVPAWFGHFSIGPIYQLWPASIRLRALFGGQQYADLVKKALDAIKSVRPEVIAARVKAILNVNVEQDLMKTNVPLLYLAARRDYLIKSHNVAGIKQMKPDMTVADIDTQHFLLQLEPEKSVAAIVNFIDKIKPGRAVKP